MEEQGPVERCMDEVDSDSAAGEEEEVEVVNWEELESRRGNEEEDNQIS